MLVSEDAPLYTVVHVIQAYDPDGDDVTFAFPGSNAAASLNKSFFIFQTFDDVELCCDSLQVSVLAKFDDMSSTC